MSDPVVEELLEKGARAVYERNGDGGRDRDGWDGASSEMKGIYRNILAVGLDAVFPGWREGITREFGLREAGLDHVEGLPTFRIAENEARTLNRQRDLPVYVVSSLTVRSAWVPVEEGTDG